ncbi:MAG: superoxide dismutase, Ni [Pseudomonadota bacterium]
MLHKLASTLDRLGMTDEAQAHCDIPCGIYDTGPALIAAVSVVRLMDIIHEASDSRTEGPGKDNVIVRSILRKEDEAEKVKHEIRIIWGDYFKGDLLVQHPNIHELTHNIMIKASACKQDVHREDAVALVELVNEFAEIFWQTKGKDTERKVVPYAPALEVVYPVL